MLIAVIVLIAVALVLAYCAWRFSIENVHLRAKYSAVIDVDAAAAQATRRLEEIRANQQSQEATGAETHARLEREHQKKLDDQIAEAQRQLDEFRDGQARLLRDHQASLDARSEVARQDLERLRADHDQFKLLDEVRRGDLNREYTEALMRFKELKRELSLVEEGIENISYGLYEPHFSFQTPEDYKTALLEVREAEKLMISEHRAAVCPVTWHVGEDRKAGLRMTLQAVKLALRAFNGECEAARADVSWNNIARMEERVRKSAEAIGKLSSVLQVRITDEYCDLKLKELRLTYELEERKHQDREEQKRIREQIRDEERAQREIEKAKEEAEAEEARYQKALLQAQAQAAEATGAALQKLTEQINGFEAKLDEARKKRERAVSRAELTKSGFVYIISNIGSFGESVFKIGMTRRLEPMDRVYELGSASVPFPFDLHAMLYSDNAPQLETALHHLFATRRVNLVNPRREFYHGVALEEIEQFVKSQGLSAQFTKLPEAREYRETMAKRQQLTPAASPPSEDRRFEQPLFGDTAAARTA